jgi:hypothetical protein
MVCFDRENIICINVRSHDLKQLFAISEKYFLDFEVMVELKKMATNLPGQFTGKIWIDLRLNYMIATEVKSDYDLVPKKDGVGYDIVYANRLMIFICPGASEKFYSPIDGQEIEILKNIPQIKPVSANKKSMPAYKKYISMGYDIRMESFERILSSIGKDKDIEDMSLKELGRLMREAVEDEKYELAAKLRDRINSLK